ncbi:carbohydrate-binding protein [Novipirellula artificiosorum]|uniref:Endo-1,4-beta-xylanase A n=1 Tax=Novipirellula artificiosorum TaxID=2528016 RepID=A0A5C6D5K3_9BACT|nr:carbohydrate-binding protein [Novipirellula artificiosorum]TWU31315.1 Endo-1,4-beta-xylanase A precursor [Novipirellula artificiosorum]
MNRCLLVLASWLLTSSLVSATEYHVSPSGSDTNRGTEAAPLKTISAASLVAQPGDTITVHGGVYRERIDPPRGGTSDLQRIVYQAAEAEQVCIKGSEIVKGWERVQNSTWKVKVPNEDFGSFNPFSDVIKGDWFNPLGRVHHSGAVYLDGHWLTEAANETDVLKPIGEATSSYLRRSSGTLLNVAWLEPGSGDRATSHLDASGFTSQHGIQKAPCSEGGECIGWIESGDSVCYENVNFGTHSDRIAFRVASATRGGMIEAHMDDPDGELLGTCKVPSTGDWQAWSTVNAKIKPTSGTHSLCLLFKSFEEESKSDLRLWFATVDDKETTIWAQFKDVDPNQTEVEINVRQAILYPSKPGIDYLTVRGFKLVHAATPWAPPTSEQIGLIGTHWSKGWIIEDNEIGYSVCTGITLGKHGDEFDNTSQNSAEGYVETIHRATQAGWSKDKIGHHVVRNNHISHCEQAGIVGSMGATFSNVTDNVIHDIHIRRLFTGAEMAGIKFHGAIDSTICHNRIYRCSRGIWLDWMTQGTRVSRNLLYDNGPSEDLFLEVNHGPALVDHNLMLSTNSILVNSQGAAYVHNLIAGRVHVLVGEKRLTPFLDAHSSEVAGLAENPSGDERYYNNLFVSGGLAEYDSAVLPVYMAGNVFLKGAKPSRHERDPVVLSDIDPSFQVVEKGDSVYLRATLDPIIENTQSALVTTERLGKAKTPDLPYEQPNGKPYRLDLDYLEKPRNVTDPSVGPFEKSKRSSAETETHQWKVW